MSTILQKRHCVFEAFEGGAVLALLILATTALCRPTQPTFVYGGLVNAQRWKGWRVYASDVGGSPGTRLTDDDLGELSPAWSPDGARIAFGRMDAIVVMDWRSRDATEVALGDLLGFDEVDWSPDGMLLLFSAGVGEDQNIYTYALQSGAVVQLTHGVGRAGQYPCWSRSGERIVYTWRRDIYTMDADGGNQQQLTDTLLPEEMFPTWSPDGSEIAYFGPLGQIHVMRADGKKRRVITQFAEPVPYGGLSWLAESDLLLFSTWVRDRGRVSTIGPAGEDLEIVLEEEGLVYRHVRLFTPSLGVNPGGLGHTTLGAVKQGVE